MPNKLNKKVSLVKSAEEARNLNNLKRNKFSLNNPKKGKEEDLKPKPKSN